MIEHKHLRQIENHLADAWRAISEARKITRELRAEGHFQTPREPREYRPGQAVRSLIKPSRLNPRRRKR